MKTHALLITGLFTMASCSSELDLAATDVPPAVNSAFQAKYPGATDAEWEAEKNDGYLVFEVEFEHEGKNKEAIFKPDGSFVEED